MSIGWMLVTKLYNDDINNIAKLISDLYEMPIFSQLPASNPITMIHQERQECLNTVFHDIESLNRRRAFVSTKYVLAHEQFDRTLSEVDKKEIEKYKTELEHSLAAILSNRH